jgi:hypothetical protein
MPRWLKRSVERIRELAAQEKVRFTLKALRELGELELGLDEADARRVLTALTVDDSGGRTASEKTGEWMYVFRPEVAGTRIYLKLVFRTDCVVISFHGGVGKHDG